MNVKEPQFGPYVQFGLEQSPAVITGILGDVCDTIKHEHVRQRKLGIAGPEKLAMAAFEQFIIGVGALTGHRGWFFCLAGFLVCEHISLAKSDDFIGN